MIKILLTYLILFFENSKFIFLFLVLILIMIKNQYKLLFFQRKINISYNSDLGYLFLGINQNFLISNLNLILFKESEGFLFFSKFF